MGACPTGAIHRDASLPEIVLIDARKCIACGMCAILCPFDVITYHASLAAPEKVAVALKCDHCIDRQRQGLIPACVEACKVNALEFGEINELVKTARMRYSAAVSLAVGQVGAEITPLPIQVDAWRKWGLAVTNLNANGQKGA
jgi:carbon-monoxide dehydrogenase iron sulfur subunit